MKKFYCHYTDGHHMDEVIVFSSKQARDAFCEATDAKPIKRNQVREHLATMPPCVARMTIFRLWVDHPVRQVVEAQGLADGLLGHVDTRYPDGLCVGYVYGK